MSTATTVACTVLPSPIGDIVLTGDGKALSGVFMGLPPGGLNPAWHREPGQFRDATAQLEAYFSGALRDFDLMLRPVGTPFQLAVWEALRTIPYGQTRSYGEIAAQLGRDGASRAVGAANASNPLPIVVPCHRVIGADGRLTGFGGGLPRKQWLLAMERGQAQMPLEAYGVLRDG
jgi:methylated-DNA-[protein]-cysteine S-methyltransferase